VSTKDQRQPQGKAKAASSPATKDNANTENRFVVRLPAGLHRKIKRISQRNKRSMNAEIVLLLQSYLLKEGLLDDSPKASLKRKLAELDEPKRQALLQLLE
jgi:hypothetical protein